MNNITKSPKRSQPVRNVRKRAKSCKKMLGFKKTPDGDNFKVCIPKKTYLGPKLGGKTFKLQADKSFEFVNVIQEEIHTDSEIRIKNENPPINYNITGNRIIDFNYFMDNLMEIQQSHLEACPVGSLNQITEEICGLVSKITFTCNFCSMRRTLFTHNPNSENLNLNTKIVQNAIAYGPRVDFLQDMFEVLDIPQIQVKRYSEMNGDLKKLYKRMN